VTLIAGGTYALFSDQVTLTTHLKAGTLDITLHRVNLKTLVLDNDTGYLTDKTSTEIVDFSRPTNRNVFDIDSNHKIVPGCTYDATLKLTNSTDVAFLYWVEIINRDLSGVDLADQLIANGYNPAILNLASAKKPGGGYRDGLKAQEESICRSSNLSLSLYQFGNPKYVNIRESGVPLKKIAYPLDINFGGVYTPNVMFFRNNKTLSFTLREKPFLCDVITVAALSFNGKSIYANVNELEYRSPSGGFTPDGEEIMLNKIRTIFRMGVEHGKDALILGAFGCGAYKLPVAEVARLFRVVMEEPEFQNKFRLVVFAIMESTRRANGIDGKYAAFYREFGTYSIQ
jgi:uncharacterized protein (TIGR02452 family)